MAENPLTRATANVNAWVRLSWIYSQNAQRVDVLEVDRVEIYDRDPVREDFKIPPVQVIPAADVFHPAQGVYEYLMMPVKHGNKFYYDVVYYRTQAGEPLRRNVGQLWVTGDIVETSMPIEWINKLRTYLHDDQPDTDYQFAPPSAPQVQFGMKSNTRFLYRDSQLDLALQLGLSRINQVFPYTGWNISYIAQTVPHYWLQFSMIEALRMKSVLQISEEFNYSVGSLSLEINRFEKYSSMIDGIENLLMDPDRGFPKTKHSLTVYSRTAMPIARNLFPSGVSNYSLSQGFPAGSATATLFV